MVLDEATRAALRHRRWRVPGRNPRQRWMIVLAAVALHLLFVLAVRQMMQPSPATPTTRAEPERVLQVRFISRQPSAVAALPPAPIKPVSLPVARPRPRPIEPPAKDAMTVQLPTPALETRTLYDKDGQPVLPAAAASAATPGYVQNRPQGDTQIMRHGSPVTYQATRFDKAWGGDNVIDSALQKLVDKTTVKKTIHLPGGVRIHCGVSLAMLGGGCGGDPPAPPSAKDGDQRLSMAPTTPLDGAAHTPTPPSVASCIAMYRDGKPLAWGCPIDTPNRSVDAELRDRAAGAAAVR